MARQFLRILRSAGALLLLLAVAAVPVVAQTPVPRPTILWTNPLDLVSAHPTVTTAYGHINYGNEFAPGGLSGLVILSSTTGDTWYKERKEVTTGLQVPPGYLIKGVRVCYQTSNSGTFISSIRLTQLQNPPSAATIRFDDPNALTNPGPVCVNSASTSIDPAQGAVSLYLLVNFGDTDDRIVIHGLGLWIAQP